MVEITIDRSLCKDEIVLYEVEVDDGISVDELTASLHKRTNIEGARFDKGINRYTEPKSYEITVWNSATPIFYYTIGLPSVGSIRDFNGVSNTFRITDLTGDLFTPDMIAEAIKEVYQKNRV